MYRIVLLAAKWYNVSLHLGHGFTNSCHLPLPHPIDLEKVNTIQVNFTILILKETKKNDVGG